MGVHRSRSCLRAIASLLERGSRPENAAIRAGTGPASPLVERRLEHRPAKEFSYISSLGFETCIPRMVN